MGEVVLDISMTLDGFVAGPKDEIDPIHDWIIGRKTARDAEILDEALGKVGAVVMGRRTFDLIDGPEGWLGPEGEPFDLDVFVLTHESMPPVTKGETRFTFVDDIHRALDEARTVAGEQEVTLMGAETAQQFLAAGLVDKLVIHIAPTLIGTGIRLFDVVPDHVHLDIESTESTPAATHITYRVRR
jgi:dihydrofolate reductase